MKITMNWYRYIAVQKKIATIRAAVFFAFVLFGTQAYRFRTLIFEDSIKDNRLAQQYCILILWHAHNKSDFNPYNNTAYWYGMLP
jgi:hypothetical protein